LSQKLKTRGFRTPTYLFMASEVRSGSTYVAELISYSLNASFGLEAWDLTKELLRELDDHSSPADVGTRVSSLWLSPENLRSSKVMCSQLSILTRSARRNLAVQQLVFGEDARWIVVRRRNKIRQAVSLATARKSGVFHSYCEDVGIAPLEVSLAEVESALRAVILSDEYLRLFSSVPENCAEVFYEDVLADPIESIRAALDKIGVLPEAGQLIAGEVKLSRDRQAEKADLELAFGHWLLENHHRTLA
jgi:LPS sulfotransferase NodH